MKLAALRLEPGADLRRGLIDYCTAQRIEAACIIGSVGSVAKAVVRFAGQREGTALEGKREILSLSGTLSRHGAHLHIALADGMGAVCGGHLVDGAIVHTTAEIVLALAPDIVFKRELDAVTGYRELRIEDAAGS